MKQVLVMRADLKMSPGKLAAQAAHAAVKAVDTAPSEYVDDWNRNGCTKIVLQVWDEETIVKLYKMAVAAYLPAVIIADEGRTEVKPGTITGLGIGPAPDGDINQITGALLLYGYEEGNEKDNEFQSKAASPSDARSDGSCCGTRHFGCLPGAVLTNV